MEDENKTIIATIEKIALLHINNLMFKHGQIDEIQKEQIDDMINKEY